MSDAPGHSNVTPRYGSAPPPDGPPSAYARGNRRPALVTGIGVASIVVASLSLLGGLVGGLWALKMYRMSRAVTTQASSVTTNDLAATPLTVLPSPEELEAEAAAGRQARARRRDGVVELIAAVRPMSPGVRQQLDGMLARHAERILTPRMLTDDELSTGDVRAAITSSGSLPPVQAGDAEGAFIAFKERGRLELYGTRAVFVPADGSGRLRTNGPATPAEEDAAAAAAAPSVRPAAVDPDASLSLANPPGGPTTPPIPGVVAGRLYPSGLTGSQVQQVVDRAQQATGGKLNPAQIAALAAALQSQSPPLVKPQQAWSPVRLARVGPDGSATVWFSDGLVAIDPAGSVSGQGSGGLQQVTIDPIGLTLLIGEAVTSGLLSLYLLSAGIQVLRNSHRGAGLHWIYALVKLPLAVLGGVSFAWVMSDVMSGLGRMGGPGGGADGVRTFAIVMGALAVTYPIVLIVALGSRTVREFYAGEHAAAGG